MKKFATLLAVIVLAFGACLLTACTPPYANVYLEVYDAQGTKLELDEDYRFVLNDNGENDFSLSVKVRGVKKEKVTVGFTKKSSTNAFSILEYQTTGNTATVKLRGDNRGTGYLYVRVLESDKVKEIAVPIKIVKELTNLETKPDVYTAVAIGTSITLDTSMLVFTPYDTNETEVEFALLANGAQNNFVSLSNNKLSVDYNYDIDRLGKTIKLTATSKYNSNLKTEFYVNVVESLTQNDITLSYFDISSNSIIRDDNQMPINVDQTITLVKGSPLHQSVYVAINANSSYEFGDEGLEVMAYLPNNQILSVSRCDLPATVDYPVYRISSELFDGMSQVTFKVFFNKFKNIIPVEKSISVRVVDMPNALMLNGETDDVYDLDLYTEYDTSLKGLALNFNVLPNNVINEYSQIYLTVENSNIAEILVVRYVDEFGVLRTLQPNQTEYTLPRNKTIYVSLNPSTNYTDYIATGIKLDAWCYTTIDKFSGKVVTDRLKKNVTLNLFIKQGISGVGAYKDSINNLVEVVTDELTLVANNVTSGGANRTIYLDFTPTGSVEVDKNIVIQSAKPSVVKFVLGGTSYSQITGSQLVSVNKNTSATQEKQVYAFTIKGFDKGETQIIVTTGNGVTKYINIKTVAATNSLALSEVTNKIAYSLSASDSFYRGYTDIVVPVYSAINLKLAGSSPNADITIKDQRVYYGVDNLSDNEVVSLYETGSQITITAILEGSNRIEFNAYYYDMNGNLQFRAISFYIYVYMPVQAFELSTHSTTLMYNVGYFEKAQYSAFNLGVRYNADRATETIELLSQNAISTSQSITNPNSILYNELGRAKLRVYTITRILNESVFEGSLESEARMDKDNLNLALQLNELQDMPTSTYVTVNLQQFNDIVSSQRCDITIRKAVKAENIVVTNVPKKSGAYVINFDLRKGYCGLSKDEIDKYLLNVDNNFIKVLASITNDSDVTFNQIDYKIVKYLNDNGNMINGDDSTISIRQANGELIIVPHKGGEVILQIFPHDRWLSATEYDRSGPIIEINIKVSDGDKVPYQVGTVSQLLAIGESAETMSYKYELVADINLTYKGAVAVLPIGRTKTGILPFTGHLSGVYKIKKDDGSVLSVQYYLCNPVFALEDDGTEQYAGLFAKNEGSLEGVYVDNARFAVYGENEQAIILNNDTFTNYYLAGLVGQNSGSIINCNVNWAENGVETNAINFNVVVNKEFNIYVGGLVAKNIGSISANSTITSGEVNVNISKETTQSNDTHTYIGGVVGQNDGIIDGNYQSDYQKYARVFNPTIADFNNGKYYVLDNGDYVQAKTNTSTYNANNTYYKLSAGVLEANKRVLSEHISSNLNINASIATDYANIGGIAGYNTNTIGNVSYNGTIDCLTGGKRLVGRVDDVIVSYVGGLVGYNKGDNNTQNIYNSIAIGCQILTADENTINATETRDAVDVVIYSGAGAVGGAIGGSENSKLYLVGTQFMTTTGDENFVSIKASQIVGGLIGISTNDKISYCYVESFFKQYQLGDSAKKVNTMQDIVLYENADDTIITLGSGFIASSDSTTVESSYAKLNVATVASNVNARLAGLLSYGNATISNSYFKGNLINADTGAGLIANDECGVSVASTYAKGYINAPNYDDPSLQDSYNYIIINRYGTEIIDTSAYEFGDNFSGSITNNDADTNYTWYYNRDNTEYNDGDPVQLCNGVKFATLIPTLIKLTINADATGAIYKSQANTSDDTKNLLAGYKYDDSTIVLFNRSFVAGNEYANYTRLTDLISVAITPEQAKGDIDYKIVDGNIARINKVNGYSCLSVSATGKFTLRVYAIYNSALYADVEIYVTNGVSEFDLYNTTDTTASQNKLANGKALSLATDSSTIFSSKIRFTDGNVTNNSYTTNSAIYLHFDVEHEIFTINEQSPNNNFKADKNLYIKTALASEIENQDKITSVKVTPYLDLYDLFGADFVAGDKIDLLPLVREFNLRVCKRARAINTNNILAIASESSKYASLSIELETDFTSGTLPNIDSLTNASQTLSETDGLRLSISADEDSQEFVDGIKQKYGITNVADLFDISCEIMPSAKGILYNDLRIQLKEDYREIDSDLHFNLHFWADSNNDVTKDIGLTITPSSITKIVMTHFAETNASQAVGGSTRQTLQSSSATNMIVPGKSGILMISVNPIYANVDYFTIESSQNSGYTISFEQMVRVEGKDEYVTLFPRPSIPTLAKYSTIDANGKLGFDGNLYVRTILPTIVARELNFELTVNAYLNTSPTSLKTSTKTLLTAYVPSITMTVDASDAVSVYLMEKYDDTNYEGLELYARYTDVRDDAKYIYNNEKVAVVDEGTLETTYRYETAYYVPIVASQIDNSNRDIIYIRQEYFLVENNTSNISVNMEVVGYEFGSPKFEINWIDAPDEDGFVSAPSPTLVLSQRGVYSGSSNITVIGNDSNIGKRFALSGRIEVLRNGIRKEATQILKFIVVENIVRPTNVTIGNLTDDRTLTFAMGASQSLDLVWLTDSGSLDKAKQDKINQALYDCIGGTGADFSAEKLANLFYIRRNTVYGTIDDKLSLGTDSSSLFRIKENYLDRKFTGLTIIGTSQTNGTVLGFKVYYYYDENLELKFTTDYEAFKDKYILTEINFEFNLLIYYTSTEQEPIPIYTANQFKSYLSATVNDINTSNTNYILIADITLDDYEPFDANFSSLDGNGKIIRINNFTPTAPTKEATARVGLFKNVSSNTMLKNIALDISALKDINLTAYTGYEIGLLAVNNAGIITNCDVMALRLTADKSTLKAINIVAQQSTTSARFGGLVASNSGNITNSRIGVASFVSYIINSTDTKTDIDTQTYYSNDIMISGVGDMGGFAYSNSGIISSCYVRGLNFANNSTELDSTKTAGFVVNNSGRIYSSYVRGSGDSTISSPRMTSTSLISNGDVAGFVSTNSGYIGDSYANIKVFSVSKFTAGFVGSNSASIERCYSACDIETNAPRQTPFTGTNVLHELQDSSNGGIVDCYYLILSGEFFPIEDDSAQSMSISSFQLANTLNNFNFVNSTNVEEAKSGIWIYNYNDDNLIVKEKYLLPDLTSPNGIAKSLRYLNTELTDEQGNIVGYSYNYVKDYELGSKMNPYVIRYASEFNKIFADALTADDNTQIVQSLANVRFVNDIDFKDVGYDVKTRERVIFSGQIDGNGMQINGINITTNTTNKALNSLGLFSKVVKANTIDASTPIIKNITLNFTKLSGTSTAYVGGLAGIIRDSFIINVNLTGGITIQGYNYAGGLAGMITGNSIIMNVNSDLSVSVGNSNKIVDQNGNYVPRTYFSFEDYVRINKNATQTTYESYLSTLSYAGGLAGVIDIKLEDSETPADLSRPNVHYVKINAVADKTGITSVGSNVSVFADVVGGIAGYAGRNTYINSSKFYLNTTASANSVLEGYYIVGGLVGENLGKLSVSELVCDNNNQLNIDKANGAYIRGETDSISGNYLGAKGKYFAGGLIGINYQGAVEHCQTHLSMYGCDAQFVGGIVGGTLGGAFNTMYTASAMPVLTNEKSFSGGFAGITFDAFNKGQLPSALSGSIWKHYINDYINSQTDVLTGKIEVVLNRIVCAQFYDHSKLVGEESRAHNGTFIGYSALVQDADTISYKGSQLDTLYASANMPTNCFVDGTYFYNADSTQELNDIAGFDDGKEFSTNLLDLQEMSIEVLTNREEGNEADQRAEFQKVFSEWSLNYWTALDETTIYPRLLQIGFGSVIEIKSAEDFKYIEQNPSGSFIITKDINMGGAEFEDCVIRTIFTGRIIGYKEDGTAPTVYNMSLKSTNDDLKCLSFFHEINNATISNIDFRYLAINANDKTGNVAGVVATDKGGSTLSEITVGFNIDPQQDDLKKYSLTQTLSAENAGNVGALIAESYGTNVVNCEAQMNIKSGADNIGGLIGYSHILGNFIEDDGIPPLTTIVSSCYYGNIDCKIDKAGEKQTYKAIGGLVGQLERGAINNSRTYLLTIDNTVDENKISTIEFNENYNGRNEDHVGGLVGWAYPQSSNSASSIGFTNCEIAIKFDVRAGVVDKSKTLNLGYAVGSATDASFTTITISRHSKLLGNWGSLGDLHYGGIVGQGSKIMISECTVLADLNVSNISANSIYIGGAVGYVVNNNEVSESKLSGVLVYNTISFVIGEKSVTNVYVGGIVGCDGKDDAKSQITIRTSAHFGEISIGQADNGNYYVGGIIGSAKCVTVEACQTGTNFAIDNITSNYYIAGIVGYANALSVESSNVTITRCIMLSYFKLANNIVRSNNALSDIGVDPICMGSVNSGLGNIYSADYSFVVARKYFSNNEKESNFLTDMRADQLIGKLTNSGVLSIAVDLALGASGATSYVLNRADASDVGSTDKLYAMGRLPSQIGTQAYYVMPYLITLGNRMNACGLFEEGTIMRPYVVTKNSNINMFGESCKIYLVLDDLTFSRNNVLNSRIVGCNVTFALKDTFINEIKPTGAISGVVFDANDVANPIKVDKDGGIVANTNNGGIFNCHIINTIKINTSKITSTDGKFGCVVGTNNGTIFGFGNSADFELVNGAKKYVSGIAVVNNGRIEGCYVTADLTEIAKNEAETAGLVHTNRGVVYNTYFAGSLSDGGDLDDALKINAATKSRVGGQQCHASTDFYTNKDSTGVAVGTAEKVYVDFYANCKERNIGTETTTTRELFEDDGIKLTGNIWATQRYESSGTVKGKLGNTSTNTGLIINLNYGYPIIHIGTKVYDYNETDPSARQWITDADATYIGRDTGDGSKTGEDNSNPIQIINLGVLDYTRSLYINNESVKEYILTRNIFISENNNYVLTSQWFASNDPTNTSYYGNTSAFKQIFNGNGQTIYNLNGGALFWGVETSEDNGKITTIRNLNIFNAYHNGDSAGVLINTLTSGRVENVNIYGTITAESTIANSMSGGTITGCKILVDSISGRDSIGGIVNTISGGRVTNCQVGGTIPNATTDSSPVINAGTSSAGLAYQASGEAVLQRNTVSGATIRTTKSSDACSAGAIAICKANNAKKEEDYVLADNTISATVANSTLVGGLVAKLQSGNIYNNNRKGGVLTLQGTDSNAIVGGIIGITSDNCSGFVVINNITIDTGNTNTGAESINKFFGGLLGQDNDKAQFISNTISGKIVMNKSNTTHQSTSGGLVSIPKVSTFDSNNISITMIDHSTSKDSAVGGYFGRIDSAVNSAYAVSEAKTDENGVEKYTNSNSLTETAEFQGVYNVGLQVGYMSKWCRSALDTESSKVNQGALAIGCQNVGGMVGAIGEAETEFKNLKSKGIIKTGTTLAEKKNFGGIFGLINDKDLDVTLSNMENGCNINAGGADMVGGIIGKLGLEPKYDNRYKNTVNTYIDFDSDDGVYKIRQYTIKDCKSSAIINGRYYVGGIIGSFASQGKDLVLQTLSNDGGTVIGQGAVGGVLGLSYTPGSDTTSLQISGLKNSATLEIASANTVRDYFGGITGTLYSTKRKLYTTLVRDAEGNIDKKKSSCDFKGLENSGAITGGNYTGGLFGKIVSTSGSITGFKGITVGGEISGKEYVGGIMGEYTIDPTLKDTVFEISNITSTEKRKGTKYVGGLFGKLDLTAYELDDTGNIQYEDGKPKEEGSNQNVYASITDVKNSASIINEGDYAGGIIGYLDAHKTVVEITSKTNTAALTNLNSVDGKGYVGGIFGRVLLNNGITVKRSIQGDENNGEENTTEKIHSTITKLKNTGNITGGVGVNVGGIIGYLEYTDSKAVAHTVYNLTNGGAVNASEATNVGGIFGSVKNYHIYGISASTATDGTYTPQKFQNIGAVSGGSNVGGIIGFTSNDVSNLNGDLAGKTALDINWFKTDNKVLEFTDKAKTAGIGNNISNTGSVTGSILGSGIGGYVGKVAEDAINGGTTNARIEYLFNTEAVIVQGFGTNVGGIVGDYYYPTTTYLMSITSKAESVSGANSVGGLIGNLHLDATIAPTFIEKITYVNSESISGTADGENVGGMFGKIVETVLEAPIIDIKGSNIVAAIDVGTISGGKNVGGIAGYADYVTLQNIGLKVGSVIGTGDNVGGFVGNMSYGALNYAYNITESGKYMQVKSDGDNVGGLVGYAKHVDPAVSLLSNIELSGKKNVGGYIGYAEGLTDSLMELCVAIQITGSSVSGKENVGGLIGYSKYVQLLRNKTNSQKNGICVSMSSVVGTINVGGLIGYSEYTYVNNDTEHTGVYMTVKELGGTENVGGIIGLLKTPRNKTWSIGIYSNSYNIGNYIGEYNYTVGNIIGMLDCEGISNDETKPYIFTGINKNTSQFSEYAIGTIKDSFNIDGNGFNKNSNTLNATYTNNTKLTFKNTYSKYNYGQIISNGGIYSGNVIHVSDSDDGMVEGKSKIRKITTGASLTYNCSKTDEGNVDCKIEENKTHSYNKNTYNPAFDEGTFFNKIGEQTIICTIDNEINIPYEPEGNVIPGCFDEGSDTGTGDGICDFTGKLNSYERLSCTITTQFIYENVYGLIKNYLPIDNGNYDQSITVFENLTEEIKFVFNS